MFRKKIRRIFSIILAAVISVLLLSGCKETESVSEETTGNISREIQKARIKKKYAKMKRDGQLNGISERIARVFKNSFLSSITSLLSEKQKGGLASSLP